MNVVEQKKELRAQMKRSAQMLTPAQMESMAESVFAQVEQTNTFREAETIAFYWSMPDELPTHSTVQRWSGSKRIVLPVIENGVMFFRAYRPDGAMVQAVLDYLEPSEGEIIEASKIDLIIVPGVAFDSEGGRMGRGKGFYDRYLSSYNGTTIGVCMSHQMVAHVPRAEHDQLLDVVIFPCIE